MQNRIGYDFPPLPLPANLPWWGEMEARSTQAVMDGQYRIALDHYYGQGDGYIQTEVIKRANSADPKNYKPAPFNVEIPRRQIVEYTTDHVQEPRWADPDPRIQAPTLPDWVDAGPVGGRGFVSTAAAADATRDAKLLAIYNGMVSNGLKLDALLAAAKKA